MNVNEIYNAIPGFIRKYHAFRMGNRVEIEKKVFKNTLADAMGIDAELIHDTGDRYVIFAA